MAFDGDTPLTGTLPAIATPRKDGPPRANRAISLFAVVFLLWLVHAVDLVLRGEAHDLLWICNMAGPVLALGASPRGSVALLKMAQAAALLEGRPYVVPDDVKALAPAVLRHRVTVAPELELEGVAPDTALRGIIEKIEAPK